MPVKICRWPVCRQVAQRERRTEQMIERLCVDAGALVRMEQGDTFAEVRLRCFECSHSRECRNWLDRGGATCREPWFCPNLKTFLDCRRRQNVTEER